MSQYRRDVTNKVLDHYLNPRNCGVIDEPTSVGELGNTDRGVKIKFFISVQNNCIEDIKFQTFGCITSIASASALTQLVKGKSISETSGLTALDISKALDNVPPEKIYCCELAIGAFKNGIKDYIQLEA